MFIDRMSQETGLCNNGYRTNPDGSMVGVEDVHQRIVDTDKKLNEDVADSVDGTDETDAGLTDIFCKHTSAHGFKHASSPDRSRILRSLWVLALIVAATSLTGTLSELFVNYHTYPIKTLLDVKYVSELPFPSVTMCYLQPFSCRNANLLPNVTNGSEKLCRIISVESRGFDDISHDYLTDPEYQDILALPTSQIYTTVGMKIKDTLKSCSWNNVRLPCQNMFKDVHTLDGTCFQFNFNNTNPISTSSIGPSAGLTVLAIQPGHDVDSTWSGIEVFLHNTGTHPSMISQGFLMAPGFTTFGKVSARQISHLPYPYKSFGENYCILQQQERMGPVYSRESCIVKCAYNLAMIACNCTIDLAEFVIASGYECTFRQTLTCVRPTFEKIVQEATVNSIVCPSCNYSCQVTTYSLSTSQSIHPKQEIMDKSAGKSNSTTPESQRFKYIEFRLFYDQMTKEEIRYEPEYTWNSMLGTIGGQMGFFIGASVLTLLEMVECMFFMACLLCVKFSKRFWQKKHSRSERPDTNHY